LPALNFEVVPSNSTVSTGSVNKLCYSSYGLQTEGEGGGGTRRNRHDDWLLQSIVTNDGGKLGIYCSDNLPDSFGCCCMPDDSDRVMHR